MRFIQTHTNTTRYTFSIISKKRGEYVQRIYDPGFYSIVRIESALSKFNPIMIGNHWDADVKFYQIEDK